MTLYTCYLFLQKISKIFLKQNFKLLLHNKSNILVTIIILGLLKVNSTKKK